MKRVYLDNLATTPVHPNVVAAMIPFIRESFGNPQSLHSFGKVAKDAIEDARAKVAHLIGAKSGEIFFTSSGAESNNFALKGVAFAYQKKGNHIIVSRIEHESVLHSAKFLEKLGFNITYLPVDSYGLVDPDEVRKNITKQTILISVMHANNEIGTIEPVQEIGRIAREAGIVFHTDAVATVGHIPVNVDELNVDLLSLTGHQFYGPKGIGALYIRSGVRIIPFIDGGIQEGGRRAGTENVPGIVGLGKAAEMAEVELEEHRKHLIYLRDKLIKGLTNSIERVYLNGHPTRRIPTNVSVSFEFVEGESLTMLLDMKGVAVSTGSACASRALKTPYVLQAIGIPSELAQGTLLFTLGRENTEEEIDYVLQVLPEVVGKLREMSPTMG